MLGNSHGYETVQNFQDSTAHAYFRFLDSQVNYQPRELTLLLLLRALQNSNMERSTVGTTYFRSVEYL